MNEFKKRREELGLTQKEISEKIHIPKRTWQDWELEQRMPPKWALNLILKEMGKMKQKQEWHFGGLEPYTAAAIKFAEDSKEWPADVINSLEFVTHRSDGTYEETCDNGAEGGLDVSWAFHMKTEEVRQKALQNFSEEIKAIIGDIIEEAAIDECNPEEVEGRISVVKRYF